MFISTILIKSENSKAVSYLNNQRGCRFPILNDIIKDIFLCSITRNIWLVAVHISQKLNVVADLLSRNCLYETEQILDENVFNKI